MLNQIWNTLKLLLARLGRRGTVHYIAGTPSLPPPLTAEQEKLLLDRMGAGDRTARDDLITHNLRLVVYLSKKFETSGVPSEDIISIGTIGLIKGVNTYRGDKNTKLATYASRCIENEILMVLRKHSGARSEVSIDEPLSTDWDGNELLLSDILGTEPDCVMRPVEDDADREMLRHSIDRLSEREKTIISMRFGLGGRDELTQKEVADLLGISQSYISRLEKKIISRLKKEMTL